MPDNTTMSDNTIATLEHILVGTADLTAAELAYVVGNTETKPTDNGTPPAA